MAAPVVANSAIGNAIAVTSVTTAGVTTTTGSRFLVLVPPYATTPTSVTDSKGNTYSLKVSYLWVSFGATFTVYECVNGTGGAGHTATVNWSSSGNRSATFLEITGSGSTGFTVTAADTSSPYTITSPTLTSSEELAILMGAVDGTANPVNFAESTGFTIRQSQQDNTNYNAYFVASKNLTGSTAAITASFTGSGSTGGAAILIGFLPLAPTITSQPTPQQAPNGGTATFSVTATASAGSLSYLWYKNSVSTGITTSSYTTPTLTYSDNGNLYYVVVTDSNNSVTSDTVRLGVYANSSSTLGQWDPVLRIQGWF